MQNTPVIGLTCAYTPLALIDAAGCAPYRLLPTGDWPDQAGRLLHDNICPTVKRLIDRALSNDLPDMVGLVFINSCDAMRRMADAWERIRKNDNTILLDLPATSDEHDAIFFQSELERLVERLEIWIGKQIPHADILGSIEKTNQVSSLFEDISSRFRTGKIPGGRAALQNFYNQAVMQPLKQTIDQLEKLKNQPDTSAQIDSVPVYLFGNVMPDPEAFSLIESCGARIADDDFCTGSRMFPAMEITKAQDVMYHLSKALLYKPPCARTFNPKNPIQIAEDILNRATAANARGVIGHTVKFCDPYLERLPVIRETLKNAGMPLLILEGDCSLRSIGQQKTRIEAFIEMLK
jgi:benzoyl-CoA reductase/2-hydroxyglutaryl-CoA dehydratase subunit BcrC/BadD/HgdB